MNFQYGINYIYNLLWSTANLVKMCNMFPYDKIQVEKCYPGLFPQLQYFFLASYYYMYEKKRSFCDELINTIEIIELTNHFSPEQIATMLNNVLYDLSGKCTNHWFNEFNFNRDELLKLFTKSSGLMKKASLNQKDSPHKGILCMAISNFVLRSRNDYDFSNVYKCIKKEVADMSFGNGELWMKKRSHLNDKREGKVMREVFSNRKWIKYDWAKSMKFTYERESFTCSFSREIPNEKMKKEYGEYVYGYHNDTIGPSITTLIKCKNTAKFSQYIFYDVLYSRDEFRNEMNYLFSIIDSFTISDEDKRFFLEQIIDYWKLTIKDKRWEYEKERRYEIIHFNEYEYTECTITDELLKNKAPLLSYPDFIVGENYLKPFLMIRAKEKATFQSIGEYPVICKKCLYRYFPFGKDSKCPICGSNDYFEIQSK